MKPHVFVVIVGLLMASCTTTPSPPSSTLPHPDPTQPVLNSPRETPVLLEVQHKPFAWPFTPRHCGSGQYDHLLAGWGVFSAETGPDDTSSLSNSTHITLARRAMVILYDFSYISDPGHTRPWIALYAAKDGEPATWHCLQLLSRNSLRFGKPHGGAVIYFTFNADGSVRGYLPKPYGIVHHFRFEATEQRAITPVPVATPNTF